MRCLHVSALWVAASVVDRLHLLATAAAPEETGGLLLGYTSPDGTKVVRDAIGPGPGASHAHATFEPDHDWQTRELEWRYLESDGVLGYLGDWHSHPGAAGAPSRRDLGTMRLIAHAEDARAPQPLMGIVEVWADGPPRLRMWLWDPLEVLGVTVWPKTAELPYHVAE